MATIPARTPKPTASEPVAARRGAGEGFLVGAGVAAGVFGAGVLGVADGVGAGTGVFVSVNEYVWSSLSVK